MNIVMTRALFCLLLICGSSAVAEERSFSVPLIDGGEFSLQKDARGRPVLLRFWATWCHACLKQMPEYRHLYERYRGKVQFLAVNVAVNDPVEKVRNAVHEHGLEMPVAYDQAGVLWNQFDIMGTPTYLLLDAEGRTLFRGSRHDARLVRALEQLPATEQAERRRPPRVLADLDGRPQPLLPKPGETLIAYHFAIWCESYLAETEPLRAQECAEFRRGIGQLARLPGIRLVGFATRYSSDVESLQRYRDRHQIAHSLVFDSEGVYASRFSVRDFPHLVVLRSGAAPRHWRRIDENLLEDLQH